MQWEIDIEHRGWFWVWHYLCLETLKRTHTFCTFSSAFAEMRTSLLYFWMWHCLSRQGERLICNGLCLQRPFLGLKWRSLLRLRALFCFILTQMWSDWSTGVRSEPMYYLLQVTWLTLQFEPWPRLSNRFPEQLYWGLWICLWIFTWGSLFCWRAECVCVLCMLLGTARTEYVLNIGKRPGMMNQA